MSKTHMNRLSRAEKALGLIEDGEDEFDDPEALARGRAALIALKETRHPDRKMTAGELAEIDARLAAGPKIRLSEAAKAYLDAIRATRGLGGSEVAVLPVGYSNFTPS